MKAEILNKRKKWLIDNFAAQSLDIWPNKADELKEFSGTLKYFGIQQNGQDFVVDAANTNSYFKQSLNLFKILLKKQIANEEIGLPSLEQLPQYDALITILGFSPEPLMHTALALAPKKLYPVATEESAKDFYKVPLNPTSRKPDGNLQYFETIIKHYKESSQDIMVQSIARNVASIGSLDTFKRVREIIQEVRKDKPNAKIALDITGGKKSADASAFLTAAIEENIDIYYVDFEDYKDNQACCGTEFLNKLDNPYHIYNIQLLNQAKELFRNHDYAGANTLFNSALKKLDENIVKKYSLKQERRKIENMQKATECYMYWDRFEYTNANNIEYVEILKDLMLPNSVNKIYEVSNQFEYVKKLCFDRYENANRRFNQGRYEDALTRYSQSFEISCKSYLIKQIISGDITVKIASKDSESEKSSDTWKEWQIDYASIAGILNWLLCIQKLKWKINQLDLSLAKRSDTTFKDNFSKSFGFDNGLSNNEFIKKVESYSDLIEHRNDFIHVSSIAAKKEQVNKFRIFVFNFLQCLYGNIDLSPYTFSIEFNEDGAFIG